MYLQSAELAVERVLERVRVGGHNIPEDVIRRRYRNGLRNFFEIYQPIADSWRVLDVSEKIPEEIAFGDKIHSEVLDENIWNGRVRKSLEISKENNEAVQKAIKKATREALKMHKLVGNSIAVWKDGKVVLLKPEEIPM